MIQDNKVKRSYRLPSYCLLLLSTVYIMCPRWESKGGELKSLFKDSVNVLQQILST